jgi:hypothetical protein
MFYNYDNNVDLDRIKHSPEQLELKPLQSTTNSSLLYNLKGEMYGVEVRHNLPFTLYFHLEELNGWSLTDFISQSTVEFKILTQNHKVVVEKEFNGYEIFTANGDLVIHICHEDAMLLKQESYRMELVLKPGIGFYKLFSEQDSLLVVR